MMKFGTQLDRVAREFPRPEALVKAKAYGCQGLEVLLPTLPAARGETDAAALLAEAKKIRGEFDAAGLEIISFTPSMMLKHVEEPAALELFKRLADALGTTTIRMFFTAHVRMGGPKSTLKPEHAEFDGTRNSRHWQQRDGELLAKWVKATASQGLRFAFELHHGFWVNSASAAMRMLDSFSPQRVGILMDPGNMVIEGNEGWRNSVQIMGPYLAYIHCKNAVRVRTDGVWSYQWDSLEDGVADYAELVTALKDEHFTGYMSIEDLRNTIPAEKAVGGGIAYLKGLAQSDKRVMPI
ncbi:MAG: sugar phosphate isomerase/epimerase [Phycisphaeraceae bacterium]|nr:sugar phosphate isomerase/epimerase [Phycisphaeraceae bacterium]